LLTSVLFSGDYKPGPALKTRFDDGPEPVILAQVLVRGQGKTDGFHQCLLRVPERIKKTFMTPVSRDALGKLAEHRVKRAAEAEREVLHPALCVLLQGDPDKLNLRDDRTRRWIDRLDKNVDGLFFDDLWADAGRDSDEANHRWDRRLFELARRELDDAIESASVPLAVQDRAVARAGFMFHALVCKKLPGALEEKPQEEETS
ncbi:MAG: type I-E CRISPR-associated protein Cse1/CasA, partial [bacterium]|nr:type I-E CRISPR-associated protein Cse1/CasA [bacterium]